MRKRDGKFFSFFFQNEKWMNLIGVYKKVFIDTSKTFRSFFCLFVFVGRGAGDYIRKKQKEIRSRNFN